jgi:hypothetical protein
MNTAQECAACGATRDVAPLRTAPCEHCGQNIGWCVDVEACDARVKDSRAF